MSESLRGRVAEREKRSDTISLRNDRQPILTLHLVSFQGVRSPGLLVIIAEAEMVLGGACNFMKFARLPVAIVLPKPLVFSAIQENHGAAFFASSQCGIKSLTLGDGALEDVIRGDKEERVRYCVKKLNVVDRHQIGLDA